MYTIVQNAEEHSLNEIMEEIYLAEMERNLVAEH
jgi:hypothetical protein